ncbi:hypothetical protein ES708_10395 [subsurface metagenome]
MDTKYKVLESRQIKTLSPTGASVSQYRVWIQTERGSTGAADIDAADWTAEKLKPILDRFAADLDLAFTLEA